MAEIEQIKPIYGELIGYLAQAPPTEIGVLNEMSGKGLWEQFNQTIDKLNQVTGEDYSRFKIVPETGQSTDGSYLFVPVVLYRSKLNGLIMSLHGQYFSKERAPFSGEPSTVIVQTQEQKQIQENNQNTKSKDLQYLLDMLLKASNTELLLVALFAFVILIPLFNYSIDFLDQHSGWKLIAFCVFVALYILAVIILFLGRSREKKFSAAKDRIEIWLKEKVERRSFDTLRKELNDPSLTDAFLKKLLKKYPKVFRSVEIKRSQGNMPGITLTRNESQDTQR